MGASSTTSIRQLFPASVRATAITTVLTMSGIVLIGCRPTATPQDPSTTEVRDELKKFVGLKGKIDIAGGTAHIPVMHEAVKRISAVNQDIRISVAGGGSGVGIKKVGEGLVEIGNTGRALSDKEKESHGLITFPFALDGVAIVVHPSNPVTVLTAEHMRKLYAGEVVNWKGVGGSDADVHLFTRDEASGTREVFWEVLLGKGTIAPNANVAASNGAIKVAVGNDPLAIGYISIGHVDDTVKSVAIDGTMPTQENARSGKYRVVRKLYMNTKGQPNDLVRAFIDYIRGPEGETLVRQAGFISVLE